ncbi:protease SohB [Buchnera aphidicola (Formosaphis micheliae)]|uniref:protease SohB n=1 Tax=Buchnera aphidicola TaxID=9 RepID=UPI0031B85F43
MYFIYNYGFFLIKTITICSIALISILFITHFSKRASTDKGDFKITHLKYDYHEFQKNIAFLTMTSYEKKIWIKQNQQKEKRIEKNIHKLSLLNKKNNIYVNKPILYVLDFKGNINASEVNHLREEISAIVSIAKENDEVFLRLESSGGIVNSYGFAACQLKRLRQKGIYLTVAIDKIAASGGYMMASVANYIIAAPFAIVGSIGVVAQLPNFNNFLKKNNIDIELHTAGKYKRTLTLFGENTKEGREKFCKELQITYNLFKSFIHKMRPNLDIDNVSTGEYWFGSIALEKKLIDHISTSDDFLIAKKNKFTVLNIKYLPHVNLLDRCLHNIIKNIYSVFFNKIKK